MSAPDEVLVLSPGCVAEAVQVLSEVGEDVMMLAGGTNLMPALRSRERRAPAIVLDLSKLDELRQIEEEQDGTLRVGALCTFADVAASPIVASRADILARAARSVSSAQVRHRATVGGNIMNASPTADMMPPLLALGAAVVLLSNEGPRRVPAYSFYAGHRRPVAKPSELLSEVRIPAPAAPCHDYFRKVGMRGELSTAKVAFAARTEGWRSEEGGLRLGTVRLGIGAVAETPTRLFETERYLETGVLDEDRIRRAVQIISAEITPSDDERSTPEYRRLVAGNMLQEYLRSFS